MTGSCFRETFQHWNSGMRFNPTKCAVLRISNKKKPTRKTDYQLHGHILEVVDASKYLGVTLTEDLSWDKHIQNTVSKGEQNRRLSAQKSQGLHTTCKSRALYWSTHHLSGTLTCKPTSKPWSRSNDAQQDMSSTTSQQEPQDVSQRCLTTSNGSH